MSDIITERTVITSRGIPVITAQPSSPGPWPLALINHGTGGDAEGMKEMAVRLAENGCFALSIDGVWHGRRWDEQLDIMCHSDRYKELYLTMLLEMAADMTAIIDFYEADPRVDTHRVGITGTSQGGYIAFMTMTKEPRITAAAPMIGSPDLTDRYGKSAPWEEIDPATQARVLEHNPLAHYETMAHVKLLVQNGNADDCVPVTGVQRLDEKLKPLFASHPEDYRYIEYPGLGHATPDEMQERAIAWLTQALSQPASL